LNPEASTLNPPPYPWERKKEAAERTAAVKRRRDEVTAGVEQRPGRERTMNRAVMDRVGRASAQRLFLVQRRDVSRGHGGGVGAEAGAGGGAGSDVNETLRFANADARWHAVFAVFGTTGNVYECHVCAAPSCTCPDFTGDDGGGGGSGERGGGGRGGGRGRGRGKDAGRGGGRDRAVAGTGTNGAGTHICKHLLWVYMRVLGVSRDDPVVCQVNPPTPYTPHPTPHTLHPTPYTLYPTPYTLHPTPYTLHPTPYTPKS